MKRLYFLSTLLFLSIYVSGQTAIKITPISKTGNPIIFLPHIGCSSEMWQEIAKNYSKTYSCYLIDFAGFNGQKPLDSAYTKNYVNDLRTFIQKKNLKNVILVGQNYGAFVAIKTALDKRLDIKSIIASDFYPKLSMVLDPKMSPEKLELMKKAIREGIMHSDETTFIKNQKQTAEMMNFNKIEDVNRFVQWQLHSDRRTLAETLCDQFEGDLLLELKENKIPLLAYTTWYFAKKYKNIPITEADKKLNEMYAGTPNVTHVVTEEAKDFIAMDQPKWFIQEMDKFLKLHGGGK